MVAPIPSTVRGSSRTGAHAHVPASAKAALAHRFAIPPRRRRRPLRRPAVRRASPVLCVTPSRRSRSPFQYSVIRVEPGSYSPTTSIATGSELELSWCRLVAGGSCCDPAKDGKAIADLHPDPRSPPRVQPGAHSKTTGLRVGRLAFLSRTLPAGAALCPRSTGQRPATEPRRLGEAVLYEVRRVSSCSWADRRRQGERWRTGAGARRRRLATDAPRQVARERIAEAADRGDSIVEAGREAGAEGQRDVPVSAGRAQTAGRGSARHRSRD